MTPEETWRNIFLRLISCNVKSGSHTVYPIHSFRDDTVCFDTSRKILIKLKNSIESNDVNHIIY